MVMGLLLSLQKLVFTRLESIIVMMKSFLPCIKMTPRQLLYNKGKRKISKSFTITRVLNTLQKVDLLEHLILAKYQKFFLPYCKMNILDS